MKNKFFKREMGDYFVTAGMLNHMNIAHGGKIINNADSTMGIFANSYCHFRVINIVFDRLNATFPGVRPIHFITRFVYA